MTAEWCDGQLQGPAVFAGCCGGVGLGLVRVHVCCGAQQQLCFRGRWAQPSWVWVTCVCCKHESVVCLNELLCDGLCFNSDPLIQQFQLSGSTTVGHKPTSRAGRCSSTHHSKQSAGSRIHCTATTTTAASHSPTGQHRETVSRQYKCSLFAHTLMLHKQQLAHTHQTSH